MTNDDDGASSSSTCTFTPDELDVPEWAGPDTGCSRPVWEGADADRCVWHADGVDKPPEELAATVGAGDLFGACAPESDLTKVPFPEGSRLAGADLAGADLRRADLTGADLSGTDLADANLYKAVLSGADLWEVNLTGATLREATLANANLRWADLHDAELWSTDLTGANLSEADFTGANLRGAGLTGANPIRANFTGANLIRADLTGADLWSADLTDANLRGANFTGVNLRSVDLTGADLRGADLSGVAFDRSTQCDNLPGLREAAATADEPAAWDSMARTYHALKTAFGANGLIGRARDYHFLERDAREREAKAAQGRVSQAYLGSKASRYLTGYGVRPSRVSLLMVVLFGIATVVYLLDPGIGNSLSYSVVTFTTSPPGGKLPTHPVAQGIALIETFVGTLLIVLLGYVLGNRERF